jgi:hypothetical protein
LPEKAEILAILGQDPDADIRRTARETLKGWSVADWQQVLADPAAPVEVLNFAAQELAPVEKGISEALLSHPALPQHLREKIQEALLSCSAPASAEPAPAEAAETATAPEPDEKRETLLQRIGRMSSAEKIKTALTGNQEERLVLIRDANKVVARAVLQSPKLSDMEVENFASMKNVTEEVLRLIAMNRKFMKSYNVIRSLVNNPRTPIDVSLPMLNRLNERDLKGLKLNKNVPEVLRTMATKMIKQKEEATKPKLPGKH